MAGARRGHRAPLIAAPHRARPVPHGEHHADELSWHSLPHTRPLCAWSEALEDVASTSGAIAFLTVFHISVIDHEPGTGSPQRPYHRVMSYQITFFRIPRPIPSGTSAIALHDRVLHAAQGVTAACRCLPYHAYAVSSGVNA